MVYIFVRGIMTISVVLLISLQYTLLKIKYNFVLLLSITVVESFDYATILCTL